MLFSLSWVNRGTGSEDAEKRSLKLFGNWKPPAGVEFKSFYDYADCSGGTAIIEVNSAEASLEVMAPGRTAPLHVHVLAGRGIGEGARKSTGRLRPGAIRSLRRSPATHENSVDAPIKRDVRARRPDRSPKLGIRFDEAERCRREPSVSPCRIRILATIAPVSMHQPLELLTKLPRELVISNRALPPRRFVAAPTR